MNSALMNIVLVGKVRYGMKRYETMLWALGRLVKSGCYSYLVRALLIAIYAMVGSTCRIRLSREHYLRVHYLSYIWERRAGHTSDSQINSLSEPAIQCSLSLSRVIVYFLPLLHNTP